MSDDVKVSHSATKSEESISEEKFEADRSEVNKEYDKEKTILDKPREEFTNEDHNKNSPSTLVEEIGSPADSTQNQKIKKTEIMKNIDIENENLETTISINNIAVDNVVVVKEGKNKKSKSKKSKKKVFNADKNIVKNDNISKTDAKESNILVVKANKKTKQELKPVVKENTIIVDKYNNNQSNKNNEQICQKDLDVNEKRDLKTTVNELLEINNKEAEDKINNENQKEDPEINSDEIIEMNNKVVKDEINDENQRGDPKIIADEMLDINNKVVINEINDGKQKEEKFEADRSEVNKEYDKEKTILDKPREEFTNEDHNKNSPSTLVEEIGSPADSTQNQKIKKTEIMKNIDIENENLETTISINNIAVDNVVVVKEGKNKKSKSKKSKKKVFNADKNIVKNDNISKTDAKESNILVVKANKKTKQELKPVAKENTIIVDKYNNNQSNKNNEQICQKDLVNELLEINNKEAEDKINNENQKEDPEIISDEILEMNTKVVKDEINDENQRGDPKIIADEMLDINNKVVKNEINDENQKEENIEGDRSEINKEYDKEKSILDNSREEFTNEDHYKKSSSTLVKEIGSPANSTRDQKMKKAEIIKNIDIENENLETKISINNIAVDNVVVVKKGKNKKSKKSKMKVFNADRNIVKNDNISKTDAKESNILVVKANKKTKQELKPVAKENSIIVDIYNNNQSNKNNEQIFQKDLDVNEKRDSKTTVNEILEINNKEVEDKINNENQKGDPEIIADEILEINNKVVEDEINDENQRGDPKIIADEILDINNKVVEDEINNLKIDPKIIVDEILDINNKVVEDKINGENQRGDTKIIPDEIFEINNKVDDNEDKINDVKQKEDPKIIADEIFAINNKIVEDEINDVKQKGDSKIIADEILDINNKVVEDGINDVNQKGDPTITVDKILDINNKVDEDKIHDKNQREDTKIIADEILKISNKVVEYEINNVKQKGDPKIIADEILDINNKVVRDEINKEINNYNQEISNEFAKQVNAKSAKKSVEGKRLEENIKIDKMYAESLKEKKMVVDSARMKEIEIVEHLEQDNCEQKLFHKEEYSTQNKKTKRKQKKKNIKRLDDIKEEEKENSKIESVPEMKDKKNKRKESTYIVETDFLFEIKENKNKKRKQKNKGNIIEEIAVKESEITKNGYEEGAVGIVEDVEKIKRKTLKDYLREKKAKTCTITTAIVKRLTPEEVAILTGIFPMEESPANEPVAAKLAVEKPANNKRTDQQKKQSVKGSKSNNIEGAYALDSTAPAELEPPTRKDVVLDILLEDLHEKTANLAAGEKIELFRSVLPKADIMCLQILQDKVSDADFLWANYYFTLKYMMGKRYSFLKSVLVHDGIPDRKYDPPAPRALAYTQKTHSFDILMEMYDF